MPIKAIVRKLGVPRNAVRQSAGCGPRSSDFLVSPSRMVFLERLGAAVRPASLAPTTTIWPAAVALARAPRRRGPRRTVRLGSSARRSPPGRCVQRRTRCRTRRRGRRGGPRCSHLAAGQGALVGAGVVARVRLAVLDGEGDGPALDVDGGQVAVGFRREVGDEPGARGGAPAVAGQFWLVTCGCWSWSCIRTPCTWSSPTPDRVPCVRGGVSSQRRGGLRSCPARPPGRSSMCPGTGAGSCPRCSGARSSRRCRDR